MRRLIRWHRRTGILLALFLVLLASTGILINHADELHFDQPVESSLILTWYGVDLPDQVVGIHTANGWFSQLGKGIYWQDVRVAQCDEGTFIGALWLSGQFILGCENELIVLDHKGQTEEVFSSLFGLPVPINGLSKTISDQVLIRVDSGGNRTLIYVFNLDVAQWSAYESEQVQNWPPLIPLPNELKQKLLSNYSGSDISWERVLLDLHSGRLFGQIGRWVMDFVAIAMLVLAISGLWLWRVRAAPK
ncbi:MAG: PepSY domain-containing protein [Pseudomonadales bacterium]|nr:PepSY domain-containing protein [Pseudomonadales bacterium]